LCTAYDITPDAFEISCISFPQKYDSGTDKQNIERLYPELLDTAITAAFSRIAKRTVDIIGSLVGLLVFSPFFLIIPFIIKRSSAGPVFFRQERVGRNGRKFVFYKFRSMYQNNDDSIHRQFVKKLIHTPDCDNSVQGLQVTSDTQVFKIVNDPRITPVGRILRKSSIDELPQLINVLKGDMSLVGPRPAIPYEVSEYNHWHLERIFPAKPGITGVWQVEARSTTTFENMVRMDINYIKKWSVLLDLKLIFKTPFSMLFARGAY
jgi:lipopolysaccharide/colanic/teichoic acid biosynthesis glycosyltransferase